MSSSTFSALNLKPETQISNDAVLDRKDVIAAVPITSSSSACTVVTDQEVDEALSPNQEDLMENIDFLP